MSDSEISLWHAVLFLALKDMAYQESDKNPSRHRKKKAKEAAETRLSLKRDARAWFLSRRGEDHIGSYRWVCMILELNPYIGLQNLRNENLL